MLFFCTRIQDENVEDEEQGPHQPAVDVKRVVTAAAGAALEQCNGRIPVRGGFFSATDLGTDASAENCQQSSDVELSDVDTDALSDGDYLDSGEDDAGGEYVHDGMGSSVSLFLSVFACGFFTVKLL